ncbi:MAG: CDP-alcohol phosphatidyltransferase family protein [Patescibacteria group bacterium]
MESITQPPAPSLSIKELRARCQSTAPAPERETFTGKRARFFSIYFTKLFLLTSITPNQITAISVMVFFIGVGLFLTLDRTWSIVGALLVFFATVLDGCDGEVARFRETRSLVGGVYAEPVSHDFQYGFMFLPLGLAATWMTGSEWFMVAGFLASVSKLVTRLLETRFWALSQPTPLTPEQRQELRQKFLARPSYLRFASWLKRNIFSSNGMILPLLVVAIGEWLPWYVAFYGASYTGFLALTFFRQLRRLQTLRVETAAPPVAGSAD